MGGMSARPLEPLVDDAPTWDAVLWWRLELRSLDDAPYTQRAVAVLGPKAAWEKEYGRASAGGCLQTLLYVLSIAAPTVGAGSMLLWALRAEGGQMPLALAGVASLVSVAITVVTEWIHRNRPRATAMAAVRRLYLAHIVPGLITLGIAVSGSLSNPDSGAPLWWLVPVVADIALYAGLWVRRATVKTGPRNPIENVEQTVSELAPEVRDHVLAGRNAAVDRLLEQGKIDAETASRAKLSALGMMSLTVAREERSSYYPEEHEGIDPR